ncbi:TPA: hypothetical protein DCX15_04380 [bacterium]|nr:hypothetical protein [bacterium]
MVKDELKELVYYFGLVTQIGLTVVFFIVGGVLVGIYLDRRWGTSPLFIIIATLIGIGGGFLSAYKQITLRSK